MERANLHSLHAILISGKNSTYDKVTVSTPHAGLAKRQATLQIAFTPEGNTIRLDVVFRGQGLRITATEREEWDPDVDVFFQVKREKEKENYLSGFLSLFPFHSSPFSFQKNAWIDTTAAVEWVKRTLQPAMKTHDNQEFLLLCDNLSAQVRNAALVGQRTFILV